VSSLRSASGSGEESGRGTERGTSSEGASGNGMILTLANLFYNG
jgi:hypothetical protein